LQKIQGKLCRKYSLFRRRRGRERISAIGDGLFLQKANEIIEEVVSAVSQWDKMAGEQGCFVKRIR
jgi:hypothetical protein